MHLLNGQPDAPLTVDDRGLTYGDGLFETIAVRGGEPQHLELHLARLREGCARLRLPFTDWPALAAEIRRLAEGRDRAVVKAIVTRGPGGRGYRPPSETRCTRIVALHAWPDWPDAWKREGVAVRLCSTRLAGNPALAGLKHLNRLEQVLARAEWDDPGIAEGLMLDTEGRLVEGVMTNLFFVMEGELRTPSLERAGVAGIMRRRILEAAPRLGHACRMVAGPTPEELWRADEVFVCNSVAGIWPVIRCADRQWRIGSVTRRLMEALESENE